jgi:hypothetical protein
VDTRHDEPHVWWRDLEVGAHPAAGSRGRRRPEARPLGWPAGRQADATKTSELVELRRRLTDWEESNNDPVAAYHGRAFPAYLAGLRGLLGQEPHRIRAVLLAALALGPRSGGLPGAADICELIELAADTNEDVLDLAIAWGCGWRRRVWPDHGWHSRWVVAVLSLSAMVEGSINQAVRWLEANVQQFRESLRADGELQLDQRMESYAHTIAVELATAGCRCGHGSATHRSPAGGCGQPGHQLAAWRPERCRLHAFVATAVRGSARRTIAGGAFSVSMLSGLLRDDHLLRVDTAEFRVCHRCNGDLIRLAAQRGRRIDLSSLGRGLYDLGRCPSCESPPDPERTYRVARKNWLIVPAEWGGQYHPVHRHRCGGCGNLYAVELGRCPICGAQGRHRDRHTFVWVRHSGLRHVS